MPYNRKKQTPSEAAKKINDVNKDAKKCKTSCEDAKQRILDAMPGSSSKPARTAVPQRKPLIRRNRKPVEVKNQETCTSEDVVETCASSENVVDVAAKNQETCAQNDGAPVVENAQKKHRPGMKTVAQGIVLSKKLVDDVRTGKTVTIYHVDPERDARIKQNLSKYNLNYVFDKHKHDESLKYRSKLEAPIKLPASVDLRSSCGDIFDQGDLGSCVSNSTAFCVRFAFANAKLEKFNPSRLFIYYNGRVIEGDDIADDSGLMVVDGYKSVMTYSACGENNWPYVVSQFAQKPPKSCYTAALQHRHLKAGSIPSNAKAIKACLAAGHPISFGAALYESFMSDTTAQTGIVPMPKEATEERVGGHCMTIVGYDDSKSAFLVANSWSDKWGNKGYCWFPYAYMLNEDLVSEFWTFSF